MTVLYVLLKIVILICYRWIILYGSKWGQYLTLNLKRLRHRRSTFPFHTTLVNIPLTSCIDVQYFHVSLDFSLTMAHCEEIST